jgi:hypothetical protein
MTALTRLTGEFATLLTPAQANDNKLTHWIITARASDLPQPAQLLQGSRTRPRRGERRPDPSVEQRPHRRRQHPHQEDHAAGFVHFKQQRLSAGLGSS